MADQYGDVLVRVVQDQYTQFRAIAALKNKKVKELLREILEKYIKDNKVGFIK
jgi:hypothetical protein